MEAKKSNDEGKKEQIKRMGVEKFLVAKSGFEINSGCKLPNAQKFCFFFFSQTEWTTCVQI
jgi:hypothetical protein